MSFNTIQESLLICGDAKRALRLMPADSVQTVVTSPPYWSLRDYDVRDRPTKAHETAFLLSKGQNYYYDTNAVRGPRGRRLGDVWDIPTEPVKRSNGHADDHPAMMPMSLARQCIAITTRKDGVVQGSVRRLGNNPPRRPRPRAATTVPLGITSFETVFRNACERVGWSVDPPGSATRRFVDMTVDTHVATRQLSLKSTAAMGLSKSAAHISKLTQAAWIQAARTAPARRDHTNRIFVTTSRPLRRSSC